MTDRAHMDRPASILAVVAGLLVVGASLPFAIMALPEKPTEYVVAYGQKATGAQTLMAEGDSGTREARLVVPANLRLSNATLGIAGAGACADTFDGASPYGQQPVGVTWELRRASGSNSTQIDQGTFTCADVAAGFAKTYQQNPRPNLGSVQALTLEEAVQALWKDAGKGNTTAQVDFILKVTWARPAAQQAGGLPVPLPTARATAFSLRMDLGASHWTAAVQEKPEVGK